MDKIPGNDSEANLNIKNKMLYFVFLWRLLHLRKKFTYTPMWVMYFSAIIASLMPAWYTRKCIFLFKCFQESASLLQEYREKGLHVNHDENVQLIKGFLNMIIHCTSALVPGDVAHPFKRPQQVSGDSHCLCNCITHIAD